MTSSQERPLRLTIMQSSALHCKAIHWISCLNCTNREINPDIKFSLLRAISENIKKKETSQIETWQGTIDTPWPKKTGHSGTAWSEILVHVCEGKRLEWWSGWLKCRHKNGFINSSSPLYLYLFILEF